MYAWREVKPKEKPTVEVLRRNHHRVEVEP